MKSQVTAGATQGLRLLVGRLRSSHKRQAIVTALLCLLVAGSEGIGILLLIPLLALVGISTDDSDRWSGVLGFDRWAFGANIYGVLALFLILLALRQLIVYRQRVMLSRLGLDFSHSLRTELFAGLTAAEWRHFAAGALDRHVQILTHETHIAGVAAQQCLTLASATLLCVVQIGIAAWLSMTFTLAALAGLGALALLFRRHLTTVSRLGRELTANNRSLYSITLNLLPMLRTAKMAGNTSELAQRFRDRSAEVGHTLGRNVRSQTASAVMVQLIAAMALAVALVLGVEVMGLDALSVSALILIFARLTPLLTQTQQVALQLAHYLPAVALTLESIAEWRRFEEPNAAQREALARPRHSIELRNVSGGPSDADGEPFLRDITLAIPIGALTLLTGPTGSGKSTLADIVAGLLRPMSGSILLDGRVLPYEQVAQWRMRVGYVEQAAALFTGTVEENLRWGLPECAPAELERALWASAADEFVATPAALEKSVGEGGHELSGGQRQRLAIARELLRKPSLLILDEATSGLDPATESRVLERIIGLGEGLAVLLISHRPSARAIAHQVVELEHGRIRNVVQAAQRRSIAQG
jgi:ATP-binding cassette subfamily C protein